MTQLPSLRSRILKSFLIVVFLYAILGILLVLSVLMVSGTTPKMLHLNYDSIVASSQMAEAWNALNDPPKYPEKTTSQWTHQFENALRFSEGNITETGEFETVHQIRKLWDQNKGNAESFNPVDFRRMRVLITDIVQINERGMFEMTHSNTRLGHIVLIGAALYFLITLILTLIFADGLATRLAKPLKTIVEVLRNKPNFSRQLWLPSPTTLEVLILNKELTRLWERVSQTEKLNVNEIIEQRNRLETVLESVEDAMLVIDTSGRITHSNHLLLELVGLETNQVIGHFWSDLLTTSENYLKLRSFLRVGLNDSTVIELQLSLQQRFYSVRSRKIKGSHTTHSATLYLLHDITEKKQRERFREDFINLLSHELKTPLQSLGTASEILSDHKVQFPEDLRLLVDTVAEDVQRIRAVADEFVQVSQSQSKVLKLKLERVCISENIRDWLKPFLIIAKDRRIKVRLIQENSSPIYANVDSIKFPWAISNLVINAIRFSPDDSTIQVVLNYQDKCIEIKVEDEGPGIPIEDREKVFEPFFQSNTQAIGKSRGLLGVGLTIAKEVVEAHDGRIEYFPRKPKGSTFRIVLPSPLKEIG